jgi:colicin import membrane protein
MKPFRTGEKTGEMRWSRMVVLSVFFHVALFVTVLLAPESFSTRRPLGGIVYEVDLVEMPGGGPSKVRTNPTLKEESKSAIPKDTKAKRIEENVPKQEKPLIIAKKTTEKEVAPTKKPEVSPSELIEKAISKIEKKVKSEEHLDQALSKIEQKTADKASDAGAGREGVEKGGGGGAPGKVSPLYVMEVWSLIKSNWAYPASMESKKDLEAVVVIMVKSDGTIMKTSFEKRSASPLFDDSVMKAVERSNPFPPFPEGYKRSYDEIGLTFNLKDLKNDN